MSLDGVNRFYCKHQSCRISHTMSLLRAYCKRGRVRQQCCCTPLLLQPFFVALGIVSSRDSFEKVSCGRHSTWKSERLSPTQPLKYPLSGTMTFPQWAQVIMCVLWFGIFAPLIPAITMIRVIAVDVEVAVHLCLLFTKRAKLFAFTKNFNGNQHPRDKEGEY